MNKIAQISMYFVFVLVLIVSVLSFTLLQADDSYVIDGDSVYVDDSNVFISATPHTIRGSGWVVFNITSKVYTGDVDAVLGFDTSVHQPQQIQRYNPTEEVREVSYTCPTEYFNYTVGPNYAWCYENVSIDGNTSSELQVIYEHSFDYGNLSARIIYWNETYTDEWKDMGLTFDSIDYDYQGMNKWWYSQGIPINQSQEYVVRVFIKNLQPFGSGNHKYWFAIKPSSETISEAVGNGHLYALDPWTEQLNEDIIAHWAFDDTNWIDNVSGLYNGSCIGTCDMVTGKVGGALNTSVASSSLNITGAVSGAGSGLNIVDNTFTVNAWIMPYNCADAFGQVFFGNEYVAWAGFRVATYSNLYLAEVVAGSYHDVQSSAGICQNDVWQMVTLTYNGTDICFYKNGSQELCEADTDNVVSTGEDTIIGADSHARSLEFLGLIDEVSMWNDSLTQSQIDDLWNSGSGVVYGVESDTDSPNVTITTPTAQNYSTATIVFNFTAVDDTGMDTCLYSLDYGVTNYTMSNETASVWNATNSTMSQGWQNVSAYCNDTSNNINNTEMVTFWIDSVVPVISIASPSNESNTTDTTLEVDYEFIEINPGDCWWSDDDGSTNTSLASCGTNITGNTWTEGENTIDIWINDTSGNEAKATINFELDTTAPTITAPANATLEYYTDSLDVDFNATDGGVGVDSFSINWTNNFTITIDGNLTNSSAQEIGEYYINVSVNDTLGNQDSLIYLVNVSDNTNPSVIFNVQDPSDINSANLLDVYLNISYNVTDLNLNASTIELYQKVNGSDDTTGRLINGTQTSSAFTTLYEERTNISDTWYFSLDDNNIYPATYNINPGIMEDENKIAYDLDSHSEYLKIELLNVSNVKAYSFFEINVDNQTASSNALAFFYCNSSYSTGSPADSVDCTNFYNLEATTTANHTHSDKSKHFVAPFGINITSGTINDVVVTGTSQFLLRGATGNPTNGWNISYSGNETRTNATQYSTNSGNAWTSIAGTVDSHLHQYNGTENLHYYVCANDTYNNENCTDYVIDALDIILLGPNTPDVYAPLTGFYNDSITINYTSVISPNAVISFYNISLVDENQTYVSTIQSNNSLNLSYIFDSTNVSDGEYFIRVEVVDNNSLSSYGYSDNFTIDSSPPTITIVNPQVTDINTLPFQFWVTVNETSLCSMTLDTDTPLLMNTTNNLTYQYSQNVPDGSHTIVYQCNDTSIGNIATSTRSFTLSTSGTSSGGSTPSSSVTFSLADTDLKEINLTVGQWFTNKENLIYAYTYDEDGHYVDVDSIDFTIDGITFTKVITRVNTGIYKAKIKLSEDVNQVDLLVTAEKDDIELEENIIIDVEKGNFFSGITSNAIMELKEEVNTSTMIGVGIGLIVIILLAVLVVVMKK